MRQNFEDKSLIFLREMLKAKTQALWRCSYQSVSLISWVSVTSVLSSGTYKGSLVYKWWSLIKRKWKQFNGWNTSWITWKQEWNNNLQAQFCSNFIRLDLLLILRHFKYINKSRVCFHIAKQNTTESIKISSSNIQQDKQLSSS